MPKKRSFILESLTADGSDDIFESLTVGGSDDDGCSISGYRTGSSQSDDDEDCSFSAYRTGNKHRKVE